jgi:hypothetical protein
MTALEKQLSHGTNYKYNANIVEFDGTAPVARTSSSTQMGPIISEADFSKLKSQNPELDKMVYQVIGVLPHVPAQVARQDLSEFIHESSCIRICNQTSE